ncbi:hypothetical protein ACFS4T_18865 [Pseudomonas lini]
MNPIRPGIERYLREQRTHSLALMLLTRLRLRIGGQYPRIFQP